jgi:hypothetical protein
LYVVTLELGMKYNLQTFDKLNILKNWQSADKQ